MGGVDIFLICGWNEYFEGTLTEPTIEFGDDYLLLTRTFADERIEYR